VEPNLRKHFDLAVSADPGADPGEMASAAMLQGNRIRRKRRQLAGAGVAAGVVAVLVTVAGVTLTNGATPPAEPSVTIAAAMMPMAAPACRIDPVTTDATDVAIFLVYEVTDRQRSALTKALTNDARVATVVYESRQQAYEKFVKLWKDSPDFVASVTPKSLPESYRLRLHDPAQFAAFNQEYAHKAGVQDIIGRTCAESAPVGGAL
jgi:cell division protein FtsX